MMRRGITRLAGWLVLAAFVLSGLACSPTSSKSDSPTGGSSGPKTSNPKTDTPPKRDPG